MKVSQDSYDRIKTHMETIADHIDEMREAIVTEGRSKDVEKRLRWDCLWKTVPNAEIADLYDNHGYHDAHIDTALRGIMREIHDKRITPITGIMYR